MKKTIAALTIIPFLAAGCSSSDDDSSQSDSAAVDSSVSQPETDSGAANPAAEDPYAQAQADTIESELETHFGVASLSDLLAQDPAMWAGHVTRMSVDGDKLVVAMQVDNSTPEGQQLVTNAAQELSTLPSDAATRGLETVVVTDEAGTELTQAPLDTRE